MSAADIQTLLAQFDQLSDTYMRDEVDQALQYQAELTPHLLKIIEAVADNPLIYSLEGHNAHVYAASLLSHFREPAAHRLLIRAFSIPEEQLVEIWGDMTTETLPTLLHRTCDGSIEAIKELVGNRDVDQYVRCAAMEALSYAVADQPFHRDEVVRFFQGLFTGEEAARDSHFWGNLTATLCDLHPGDSMDIISKAFADNIVSPGFISLENVEKANERDMATVMDALRTWVSARTPADIHAYISWFAEFHQQDHEQPQSKKPVTTGEKKKTDPQKNKAGKKAHKKNRR